MGFSKILEYLRKKLKVTTKNLKTCFNRYTPNYHAAQVKTETYFVKVEFSV